MLNIISGSTKKPMASEQLKKYFLQREHLDGYLYIGYPIIGTVNGAFPIDALFISKNHGLVIFNLVEGRDASAYEDAQDESANKMDAKLRGYRQLTRRRQLLVNINVVTFAPTISLIDEYNEEYPLCNENNLDQAFTKFEWQDSSCYEELVSILQAISTIRKGRKKREANKPDSRATKLKLIEDSIANLDNRQSRAVIETVEGVQRIRGLAGSGKTIVLALKAAYLHAQHPEWKIAITFNTRSLKGQFRQLINTFYIEQTNEEPDWENLHIIHAWGAPGGGDRNGIYYSFCSMHNCEYLDYLTAKGKFGQQKAFPEACHVALTQMKNEIPVYDAVLVDEAQDFSPEFLRMCYSMLKNPRRLVYAYDELQNLSKLSLPSPEKIFGDDSHGQPRVTFTDATDSPQDVILDKCYRNSRPCLVAAHALGFGIYREKNPDIGTGLVQMFEQDSLWEEIGYEIVQGALRDGDHVILKRTSESSPEFLENHSPVDDIIQFHCFDNQEQQDAWIAQQIAINLTQDELRPDDIIVINPDPLKTRKVVGPIRSQLFEKGIASHTAGVDTSPDVFFDSDNDSVAFTGIYRAKGNEAAMVYIINAHDCFNPYSDIALSRNRLFTAITRSKAWVRVVGYGKNMKGMIEEFNKIKEHQFTLDFTYPTQEQRQYLNIVNRDMTADQKKQVDKGRNSAEQLIQALESGTMFIEDLSPKQRERLVQLLEEEQNQ